MKNIYVIESYVKFNNEWEEVFTLDPHYVYLSPEEVQNLETLFNVTCYNFKELNEQVHRFPGITKDYTLFRNRPYISVRGSDIYSSKDYTENKPFTHPVSFKKVCRQVKNLSINNLMRVLTAEDFAEWWVNNVGTMQCPFTKNS